MCTNTPVPDPWATAPTPQPHTPDPVEDTPAGAFSWDTRSRIISRAGGRCELCNKRDMAHIHHRKPRRMGGNQDADTPSMSNALALCHVCHDRIEVRERAWAKTQGLILPTDAIPAECPVNLPRYGGWVALLPNGRVVTVPITGVIYPEYGI